MTFDMIDTYVFPGSSAQGTGMNQDIRAQAMSYLTYRIGKRSFFLSKMIVIILWVYGAAVSVLPDLSQVLK